MGAEHMFVTRGRSSKEGDGASPAEPTFPALTYHDDGRHSGASLPAAWSRQQHHAPSATLATPLPQSTPVRESQSLWSLSCNDPPFLEAITLMAQNQLRLALLSRDT